MEDLLINVLFYVGLLVVFGVIVACSIIEEQEEQSSYHQTPKVQEYLSLKFYSPPENEEA